MPSISLSKQSRGGRCSKDKFVRPAWQPHCLGILPAHGGRHFLDNQLLLGSTSFAALRFTFTRDFNFPHEGRGGLDARTRHRAMLSETTPASGSLIPIDNFWHRLKGRIRGYLKKRANGPMALRMNSLRLSTLWSFDSRSFLHLRSSVCTESRCGRSARSGGWI